MNHKKLRIFHFANLLVLILAGFLSWRSDQVTHSNLIGWVYLINEPLLFFIIVLFLGGGLGFIFLRQRKYGIFTLVMGVFTLYFLLEDMTRTLRLTEQDFNQLYQGGFIVLLILTGLFMVLTILSLVLYRKNKEE